MARVADYVILRDDLFRLQTKTANHQAKTSHKFQFNMPAGFHRGSRCILLFTVQPSSSSAEFRVFLNDQTTEFHGRFSGEGFFSIHEVISANVLKQSDNTLEFRLGNIPDNRVIDFGDVVLLCQVDT